MESAVKFIIQCGNADPDLLSADLFDLGCTGIHETGEREIEAFFPPEDTAVKAVSAYLAEKDLRNRMIYVEKRDWNRVWQEKIRPVRLSPSFMVYPDWIRPHAESPRNIIITPKTAFGTGHHESTRLCAGLLERHAAGAASLLDTGTGSGILAIAGRKLGIREVCAFDTDPATRTTAMENFYLNQCADIGYFIGPAAALRPEKSFDLVTVNIISSIIFTVMPDLSGRIRGKAIFSGLLKSEKDIFLKFMKKYGLAAIGEAVQNEWLAIACQPIQGGLP
jgi:ribosomal protein L11 methyltransferase